MASTTTRTKAIRLPNEVADWLDGIDAKKIIIDLYDLVRSGDIAFCEEGLKINKDEKIMISDVSEHPLIEEFKEVCDSRSMDWEYGLKKAVNAIKERKL